MITLKSIDLLLCLALFGATGCGWFQKGNKATQSDRIAELSERDAAYCALSKPIVESHGGTTDEACDAALFTSLHALQCGYVQPSIFEDGAGKLCRRPGCTCFPKQEGKPGSDSNFSKDMATGMQVFYSAKPEKEFAKRVSKYLADNKFFACDKAETPADLAGKCLMSSKIVYRWGQVEKLGAERDSDEPEDDEQALTGNTEFRAHLDILGILTEYQLYKGISNGSIDTIKEQAEREPNNLLYQAMLAKFVNGNQLEIAQKLLAKFPADRLPTSADWCSDYLYQRDEIRNNQPNPDWLPCERQETHAGTDYLLASYILNLGT